MQTRHQAAIAAILSLLSMGCPAGPMDPNRPIIYVLDNAFNPPSVNVKIGTVVTWNWGGRADHNVVFGPSAGVNSSATQVSGDFQATFYLPGTFTYICSLHAGMSGTITVQ